MGPIYLAGRGGKRRRRILTPIQTIEQMFRRFDTTRTPKAQIAADGGITKATLNTYLSQRSHIEAQIRAMKDEKSPRSEETGATDTTPEGAVPAQQPYDTAAPSPVTSPA